MITEVNLSINQYKQISLEKIELTYQENIFSLDKLFSFSNIQSKINDEINSLYNSQLFNILNNNINYLNNKEKYDFSESIVNDIDSSIEEGLKKIDQIMNKMKGNNYEINNLPVINFVNMKEDVIDKIKSEFINFSNNQINKENENFNTYFKDIISDNFYNILNNIIPTFKVDFFERNLKLNEIEKIKILYNNLKYSLYQNIIYNLHTSESNDQLIIPPNIQNDILTLNILKNFVILFYIISSLIKILQALSLI